MASNRTPAKRAQAGTPKASEEHSDPREEELRDGAGETIRAKSFIVTVLGDSVAPVGGELWLASLIALLAPFGLNERLVRTSVFRLVEEGWLAAERFGRRSLYRITSDGRRRIELAEHRIYYPGAARWDGRWTLVVASDGLDAAALRELRRELEWEGFASFSSGVFGHPGEAASSLESVFSSLPGAESAVVFRAQSTPLPGLAGAADDRALVAKHWPLAALAERYGAFRKQFEGLARGAPLAPAAAFAAKSLLIHAYRRLILQDPQLPLALLPRGWPGEAAYELARSLYHAWQAPAHEHLAAIYEAAGAQRPAAPTLKRFPPLKT